MAMNPLGVTQSGMDVPGLKTQAYPTLGPAQGGVGPGAEGAPMPGEEAGMDKPDNIANMARLLALFGINPGDPQAAGVAIGFGAQAMKRLADQGLPRGITDDPMSPPDPQQPPMPPGMSATPMPPGPMG